MVSVRKLVDDHGDLLLAVALTGLGAIETVSDSGLSVGHKLANLALLGALGGLLVIRRRIPLLLLGLLLAGALAEPWVGESGDGEVFGLVALFAVYTAAAETAGLQMWIAAATTVATALVTMVNDPDGIYLGGILFFGLLFGTPWAVGRMMRRRRLRETELTRAKVAAEAAIAEERTRIARELHDVVAHAISVIVLQARGGRRLLDTEPAETREALDAIERTAAHALAEMRRLLGLLRESDDELALAPQPTLARLDELVGHVRGAGLPVDLAIRGEPRELPPGVDLSAYRIVQEALTNALKHAGPAAARVTVAYGEDELDLEVVDDGAGSTNGETGGQGLAGIRERVAIFGGDVEAGPGSDGGFAVRARLPYSSSR